MQLRRATIEDLPGLQQLWSQSQYLAPDLERRLTEFQVAQDVGGVLVACLGLQIIDQQGQIHGELYRTPTLGPELQPLFWRRIQNLARSHGLTHLWVHDAHPFWRSVGFIEPDRETLAVRPKGFLTAVAARTPAIPWLVLSLRDNASRSAIERELELLHQVQAMQTARTMNRVRMLRVLAAVMTLVTLLLSAVAIWVFAKLMRKR